MEVNGKKASDTLKQTKPDKRESGKSSEKVFENKPEKIEKPLKLPKNKHSFVVAGTTFCVDERYELIKQIGLGAYGVVCACFDKKTNMKVAIKKVPNAFDDLVDAKRILREIKLLKYFDHENIISLLDVPKPEARTGYNDIYIVTDLMETDLHRVIYSRQVIIITIYILYFIIYM
jgi:mitogen-activated protein kinase 1/3